VTVSDAGADAVVTKLVGQLSAAVELVERDHAGLLVGGYVREQGSSLAPEHELAALQDREAGEAGMGGLGHVRSGACIYDASVAESVGRGAS